jgi:hypothetical protein
VIEPPTEVPKNELMFRAVHAAEPADISIVVVVL